LFRTISTARFQHPRYATNRLQPSRLHVTALLHWDADTRSNTLDAKDDKSSPGTGEGGRCDTADADSVSRRADIVRPFCSREVVTKRRYTTRNNQNFTSEKFAKALPVDFRRFQTQSYRVLLWEGCFSDPLG
jgi:hypothetical protein